MINQTIFIDYNIWLYRFLANQEPDPKVVGWARTEEPFHSSK